MVKVWSDLGDEEKSWLLRPWGPIGQRVLQKTLASAVDRRAQSLPGADQATVQCGRNTTPMKDRPARRPDLGRR
jgi:hypothetical protein